MKSIVIHGSCNANCNTVQTNGKNLGQKLREGETDRGANNDIVEHQLRILEAKTTTNKIKR